MDTADKIVAVIQNLVAPAEEPTETHRLHKGGFHSITFYAATEEEAQGRLAEFEAIRASMIASGALNDLAPHWILDRI